MTQANRPIAAALWMIGAIFAFSMLAVAGRAAAKTHDTFEMLGYRSLIIIAIISAIVLTRRRTGTLRTRNLRGHILRNSVHFVGQNLWFWALTAIPLAQVFALEFTSPIWVILLSALFLGEALTGRRLLAAVLGFAGALIVARPDFTAIEPGVLAAAASALFFAGNIMLTRYLTRGETVLTIMFWQALIQSFLGVGAALSDLDMALPTLQSLPWLLILGGVGFLGHLCMTMALSLAPAGLVVPIDFGRLPLIALVGALFYGEAVTLALLIGSALIIAANWINLRAPAPPKVSA